MTDERGCTVGCCDYGCNCCRCFRLDYEREHGAVILPVKAPPPPKTWRRHYLIGPQAALVLIGLVGTIVSIGNDEQLMLAGGYFILMTLLWFGGWGAQYDAQGNDR